MDIAFSTDENYALPLYVAMSSILRNADKDDNFNFYVLNNGICKNTVKKFENLKQIKKCNIEFVNVDATEFANAPLVGHFTLPSYFRIKLASLLPHLDKIIYLDCDILVFKSLKELWAVDVENNYAAAAKDIIDYEDLYDDCLCAHKKSSGVKEYFNSGVMVFNLKKMRKDNVEKKCLDFIKKPQGRIAVC